MNIIDPGQVTEVLHGWGHKNIQSSHKTTLEFTKDKHLSRNGDCIVAVGIDKAIDDFSPEFKEKMKRSETELLVAIEAGGIADYVKAHGSEKLLLTHSMEIVIRKSDYVSGRTLAIYADKAAADLSRKLVEKLQNPLEPVKVTLTVRD
jgi:hypothetical protein